MLTRMPGVVARLEEAGYLNREPDPHDVRKQTLLPVLDRLRDIQYVSTQYGKTRLGC
jgi:DNA-binding MarR family transcriptional regulator